MSQPGDLPTSSPEEDSRVYDRLHDRLQRAVAGTCPAWMIDRKDDLVQMALLRVMDLKRKSEGKRRFSSSYLWKVAHSALIDEIRRVKRRQEVPLEDDEGPIFQPTVDHPSPEENARGQQIGTGIRECLEHLVESRRQAVTLYLLGHSVPEAAEILGWTLKKTENLVYRGLADLRECLASKGLEP